MRYCVEEDEFSGDVLVSYAEWRCDSCGYIVAEYDDDFEYPEDVG